MAEERNWNLINCLCYLYNAFAVYTDGDLDEAEKKEITIAVNEWFKDSSMNAVLSLPDGLVEESPLKVKDDQEESMFDVTLPSDFSMNGSRIDTAIFIVSAD